MTSLSHIASQILTTMDEFSFFEMDPDTEPATPAKKTIPISTSVIERNKLRSITRKHDNIHEYRAWLIYVYQNFEITDTVRVCRIAKYSFHNAKIYTLLENSHVVSAGSVSSATGMNIDMKFLALTDESPSNLESAFIEFDNLDVISVR
jgi:hypothetical protein